VAHKFNRILIVAACAVTGSLFTAAADTCQNYTTLDKFLAPTFTCTVGDKIFSNFSFSDTFSGGATPFDASGVGVQTVGPSGQEVTGADIGLQFEAPWAATKNETIDTKIGFTVTVSSGAGMLIDDAGLAQISGVAGGATGSVSEDACANAGPVPPGSPCDPSKGTIEVLTFDTIHDHTQKSNETLFSPIGSISVLKDISATGGTTNGSFVNLSVVTDTFSQVPEPRAMALLLSLGLAGLAFRKRLQGIRG
jgi:hypothetical protein